LVCRSARNHLASRSVWVGGINGASSATMRARLRLIVGGGFQGVVHAGTQRIRVEVFTGAWCEVNCELVVAASHFNAREPVVLVGRAAAPSPLALLE
jgi:hypothetical protein